MSDTTNPQIERIMQFFRDGLFDEDAMRTALERLGQSEAQIAALLRGDGNVIIQSSDIEAAGRSVVGSIAEGPIVTGDNNTIINDPAAARRERLHQQCLRQLARRCNILPLAALGGEGSAKEEVNLNDVYVSLDTRSRRPFRDEAEKKAWQERSGQRNEDDRSLTALEAATEHHKLVLLGDPGSGKSTFVQQIAARLSLARLGEKEPLVGWAEQSWPLLTLLRDLAPRLAGVTLNETPTEAQEEALAAAVLTQWQTDLARLGCDDQPEEAAHLLTTEPVTLIFDGLDEVPASLRRHVRLAVQTALRRYRVARVIITCRIRSYTGAAVLPDFASHTLAPFDNDKIKAFVTAWYTAQANLGRLTPEQAEARAGDLRGAALSDKLRELAENPMLLTTMALIHQREAELPDERVRLYDEAVKVLLTRWQKRKEVKVSERLQGVLADQLKMRQILERLAYETHRRQSGAESDDEQGDLPRLAALALLEEARYLGDIGLAHEFLDYADQRAGLLVGRGGEEGGPVQAYGFPHRTFQEYLSGCYMVTGRRRGVAAEYWRRVEENDFWYLAGQLGGEELLYNRRDQDAALDLAYDLCPPTEPTGVNEWRAVMWSGRLAAKLGRTAITTDGPEGTKYLVRLATRLKQCLREERLTPLERSSAGRALALLDIDDRPGVGLRVDGLPDIEWCEVPAGVFIMGSDPKKDSIIAQEKFLRDRESPQRHIYLSGYLISRYPVTNAQYAAFVDAGGYLEVRYWQAAQQAGYWSETGFKGEKDEEPRQKPVDFGYPFTLGNHPVVGVSWYEAVAYCEWLTEKIGESGQLSALSEPLLGLNNQAMTKNVKVQVMLPSEQQWEKAARGDDGRLYPWGDKAELNNANCAGNRIESGNTVGCFPGGISPHGCEEMSGNVWEWCETEWVESCEDYKNAGTTYVPDILRITRGGTFHTHHSTVRCAGRGVRYSNHNFIDIGFRISVPL